MSYFSRVYPPADASEPQPQQTDGKRWLFKAGIIAGIAACMGALVCLLVVCIRGLPLADPREVIVGSLLAILFGLLVIAAWPAHRWRKVLGAVVILLIVLGIDQAIQLAR